ncbi:T9SS type A sorting domain-containing protein [Bacteroidota bacterium]
MRELNKFFTHIIGGVVVIFLITMSSYSCYGQLIISQYIETNSGTIPKGIELWNQSGGEIDFSVTGLDIKQGTNGGAPSSIYTLSTGTLADGDVIVIGTSDIQATTEGNGSVFYLKAFTFNGDDALEIWLGGVIQDVLGTPSSDPGTSWTANGVNTANQNISLKTGITTGDTDGWTDPSVRFETVSTDPVNDLTGFGIAPAVAGVVSSPTALAINYTTSDKINITWTKPTGTHATDWDGVVVFVRDGSANDATITGTDGIDFTADLNYGDGTLSGNSYCVARQTTDADGDIVVTGLTTGNTYYVIGYTYKETVGDNNDDTWSDASVEVNGDANIEEVGSFNVTPDNVQADLSWSNPTGTVTDYWDQVIVLAKAGSAVDAAPSGDPSAYTANAAFGSGTEVGTGNYVVYKGTGTSETVTSLTNGTEYHFAAFVYYLDEGSGHDYSSGTTGSAIPNSIIAEPSSGELVITEVNSHATANATYIELYNTTASIIRLDSVDVKHYNNGAATTTDTIALTGNLDAYSYAIVARVAATFETTYPSVSADFELSLMYVNGGTDGIALNTINNGIIDQFNDVPSATGSFTDNHLFYRVDLTTDGSSLANHWADIGSNETGTPKADNPIIWNPGGTTAWETSSNWNGGSVPTAGDDIVIKDGTSQPVILSAAEVNNLNIVSGATLDIDPDYSLTVNGDLVIDGTFIINSSDLGTGSLITLGTVSGSATFERYIVMNLWWYTSPVISDGLSNIFTASDAAHKLHYWDETAQAYSEITDDGTALTVCKGYPYKYLITKAPGSEILSFTGTLNTGDQSIPLTFTSPNTYEGYNLAGNPYPSAFDWEDDDNVTKTNINDELWYRTAGTFATFDGTSGIGTNGGQRYIPAGQGFWVKATAAGTFGVGNGARIHDATAFYKEKNENPILSLMAAKGEYTDETVLAFMDGSEAGFDAYDTEKMFANDENYPQIWYEADDELLAVNIVPDIEERMSFPLGFRAVTEDDYSIQVNTFENFGDNTVISLEDKISNTMIELKESGTYSFYSTIVDDMDRFIVHVNSSATSSSQLDTDNVLIYSYKNKVYLQNANNSSVEIYNVLGKLINSEKVENKNLQSFKINAATGYYFVKVVTDGNVYSKKVYLE